MIPKMKISKSNYYDINKILIVGGLKDKTKWINAIKNDDYGTIIFPIINLLNKI